MQQLTNIAVIAEVDALAPMLATRIDSLAEKFIYVVDRHYAHRSQRALPAVQIATMAAVSAFLQDDYETCFRQLESIEDAAGEIQEVRDLLADELASDDTAPTSPQQLWATQLGQVELTTESCDTCEHFSQGCSQVAESFTASVDYFSKRIAYVTSEPHREKMGAMIAAFEAAADACLMVSFYTVDNVRTGSKHYDNLTVSLSKFEHLARKVSA